MDALQLLCEQATFVEGVMSTVLAHVTDEQAYWKPAGSCANTIAAQIFHVYFNEDRVSHAAVGRPLIFEGWKDRLKADPAAVWELSGVGVGELRAYAAAVVAETKGIMATLSAADLEREMETPRGKWSLAMTLTLGLVMNKSIHLGDISALLGCQGLKGLPF